MKKPIMIVILIVLVASVSLAAAVVVTKNDAKLPAPNSGNLITGMQVADTGGIVCHIGEKLAQIKRQVQKARAAGLEGTIDYIISKTESNKNFVSAVDLQSKRAEFVSACKKEDEIRFLCHEKNQNYYAAMAFPIEGKFNDYQKCLEGEEIHSLLNYLPNMQPKINDPANPRVGNFFIGNGILQVTTENIPKEQILFQLSIAKWNRIEISPTKIVFNLNGDMIVLDDKGRIFVKKTGSDNFKFINTWYVSKLLSGSKGDVFIISISGESYILMPDYSTKIMPIPTEDKLEDRIVSSDDKTFIVMPKSGDPYKKEVYINDGRSS
ncbi:MAG: hypothetical protein QMD85_03255, partial [Candidatus Aenigmarchaeota archaeon]|nr:hypothetical protein [Candidatus Aenigmarchaeota archaeon]